MAKEANLEIVKETMHHLPVEKLTFDDTVILHLNLFNKSCAREISRLNKKCKLLIILNSERSALVFDADMIVSARQSLLALTMIITRLASMEKRQVIRNHILNRVEKMIICESLQGKDINLIAESLALPPKRVYTYRNLACKKLGGHRVHDLLLIKENLLEETMFL
ncbi:MAG: helix-turn-helix transcriptional regulator [Citrobacter telavivensis]